MEATCRNEGWKMEAKNEVKIFGWRLEAEDGG
jgi:hypothetical protein